MTFGFGSAVHRVMFRRRDHLEVARVIALQTLDESHAQTRSEKRVLAIGFLSASPARVAKDVDIRAPESQPFIPSALIVANELVMLCAGFSRDHVSNLMHKISVPRCRQTNRLGKHSCVAGARHAMQRFVPPFIRGNSKPFDG